MGRRIDIHIGLHKTGTTYLQSCLHSSRDALAEAGVLVPGKHHLYQHRAFWDLLGRRSKGANQPKLAGAWDALVEEIKAWQGHQVLLSDEFLVYARRGQVRRMVRALEPAEVHVVVTVRDLGRVIGSMWQQEIAQSRTWTWPEYVAAVRDPEEGAATAGVAFWLKQDLGRVLAPWESVVPREHIHVVVVPPSGSAPDEVLRRFAVATHVDPSLLTPAADQANTSVGPAETEILRQVNVLLEKKLNERQYMYVVNKVLRPALREANPTGRITLPTEHRGWVREKAKEMADFLRSGQYDVVGDLGDLLPDDSHRGDDPDGGLAVDHAAMQEATTAVLAAGSEHYAKYWSRTRRSAGESEASAGTRVLSFWRSLGFRARQNALEAADHNPLFAKAARLYLRRSTRRARSQAR